MEEILHDKDIQCRYTSLIKLFSVFELRYVSTNAQETIWEAEQGQFIGIKPYK